MILLLGDFDVVDRMNECKDRIGGYVTHTLSKKKRISGKITNLLYTSPTHYFKNV